MNTPLQDINSVHMRTLRCKASSNNSNPKVTARKMIYSEENESKEKKLKAVEKIIADEKENSPKIVKRSKRTVAESVTSVENVPKTGKSVNNAKVKKSASKKAKGESKSKKGNSNKNYINQTKFDPIIGKEEVPDAVKPEPEKSTLTTTVTEDSDICNSPSLQNSSDFVPVFNTPVIGSTVVTPHLSEYSVLTTDSWKEIAEQRRLALEKALYENEMLHDQVEVFVADNQELKRIVKEAEDLAETLKAMIG